MKMYIKLFTSLFMSIMSVCVNTRIIDKSGKYMKRTVLLIVCSIFGIVPVSAQNIGGSTGLTYQNLIPNFQRLSPEAASLGTYGSINNEEYTGSPDISIPLYTIKSGDIELPISLYYDAHGVKVNQESTWVGLGWNLNCGGCINQIISGSYDYSLARNKTYTYLISKISDIVNNYDWVSMPNSYSIKWDLGIGLSFPSQINEEWWNRYYLFEDLIAGIHSPDIFQANFCGNSFSFIVNYDTYRPVIIGEADKKYKIEVYAPQGEPMSFTITDDKGIKYVFTQQEMNDQYTSTYYLTMIESSNNWDRIILSYDKVVQQTTPTFYQSIGKALDDGTYPPLSNILGIHNNENYDRTNFNKLYLKSIDAMQSVTSFDTGTREDIKNGKLLNKIIVTSKNTGVPIHTTTFGYGYFTGSGDSGDFLKDVFNDQSPVNSYRYKRLKLDSIITEDKTYSFDYDETKPLPYKTSLAQDFWGYYNGINNGANFCATPNKDVNGNYLGSANRYSSSDYAQAGILKKITYPTGGYSTFNYELNSFEDKTNHFYFPPANNIHPTPTSNVICDLYSVAGLSNMPSSKPFSLTETTDATIDVSIHVEDPSKYMCSASIISIEGGSFSKTFSTTPYNGLVSETFKQTLSPGHYLLTVDVPYIPSGYTTMAEIRVTCPAKDTGPTIPSCGGGLRISSINNYDVNNKYLNGTSYEYAGGILQTPTPTIIESGVKIPVTASGSLIRSQYVEYEFAGSTRSDIPFMFLNSPAVGYNQVIKKQIDENGVTNGATISQYINLPPQSYGKDMYYVNNGYSNGKLEKEIILSANNDTVKVTNCNYRYQKSDTVLYCKCIPLYIPEVDISDMAYNLSIYPARNTWNYLTSKEEIDYEKGKPLKPIVTNYDYNTLNYQPSDVITDYGANNGVSRTDYFYPDNCDTSGVYNIMLEKNIISDVVEQKNYHGQQQNNMQLINGQKNIYEVIVNNDFMPVVAQNNSCTWKGIYTPDAVFSKYDNYGHLREYVTRDSIHTVILWGYNNQCPIMKIVGTTYDKVSSTGIPIDQLAEDSTLSEDQLSGYRTTISQATGAQVTAYLYSPYYTLSEEIEPNGNKTYYVYDSYGRLTSVKDTNGKTIKTFDYHYKGQ
jgi:YD repeat-containing protein